MKLTFTGPDGARHFDVTTTEALARGVSAAAVLAALKAQFKADIDVRAEAIRSAVVTPGAGQAMEYKEAQAEALAALEAPASASVEKFPMLAASIGIDVDPRTGKAATDVIGVAEAVNAAYLAWKAIGSEIRRVRLTGKAEVDAADSIEAATAAYSAIVWPPLA